MTATQARAKALHNDHLTGREYLRVSYDRSGVQRSNEQQHEDNVEAGPGVGITQWLEPYSDVGTASRKARQRRDDFDQLMEDLRAGTFGADVLVIWESSRGSRSVGEWCTLIDLCEAQGVRIFVTTHGHLYDCSRPRDRRTLQEDAVDSEYESGKTQLRVERDVRKAAQSGRPHGVAPYGYRRTYDATTGRLAGQVEEPGEAVVIREVYERVVRGDSLRAIATDLEARGVCSRGRGGKRGPRPFSPGQLRSMVLAPCYIGLRVHAAGDAAMDRTVRSLQAQTHRGCWEPLVSEELYYQARAVLTDPRRSTTRPGSGVHLLSTLARCDACGGQLTAAFPKGRKVYACHDKGCTQVAAAPLEAWATRQVLGLLTRPDTVDALLAADASGEELETARGEVARLTAERAAVLARLEDDDDEDPELAAALARRLRRQLQESEQRVMELSTPVTLRGLITPGEAAEAEWKDATMPRRREVIRALFSSGVLGVLSVARQDPGHRPGAQPIEQRVRLDGRRVT